MAWIQIRTLFTKILQIIVLGVTVWGKLSIELYYVLTCLATLVIVPLSIGKIRKETPFISFTPKFDKAIFKEMLPYCMNIFSFSLFQFSFYHLRPVFLGIQGNIESVTDFRVLNGIINVVTMLGGAFTAILLPSTAKVVARKDKSSYYKMAYDGTKYISILISFCCFGMMSVGSEVITMYVGKSYLYLIPWFNIWLLCTLGTHNQAISSLILAGTDIRAISYSSAVASIVGLLVSWLLIPKYQIGGVCIAFVVYMAIQLGFYYLYYWPKRMQINSWKVFSYSFMPYILVGVLIYFAVQLIPSLGKPFFDFLLKGIFFTIIYAITIYSFLNKVDKEFIASIVKRK